MLVKSNNGDAQMSAIYRPTKAKAAAIRDALKQDGVKANVRRLTSSYRIVLPAHTADAVAKVRDFLVLSGLRLAGGSSAADPQAFRFAWSVFEGRGQIFVYDIR
jgi:hypothetical protein